LAQRLGNKLEMLLAESLRVAHEALPGNPYDGTHSAPSSKPPKPLTGRPIERAYVNKGYRGHDTDNSRRVFISGQKRGVFGVIKRELRRRSAIEAVIGHMKTDSHLGRCYSKAAKAMPPTPSSPRSATTSGSSSPGSGCFCA
jgi:hypothetical protein